MKASRRVEKRSTGILRNRRFGASCSKHLELGVPNAALTMSERGFIMGYPPKFCLDVESN